MATVDARDAALACPSPQPHGIYPRFAGSAHSHGTTLGSTTVKDLVIGSGITSGPWHPRTKRDIKGIPDTWTLSSVASEEKSWRQRTRLLCLPTLHEPRSNAWSGGTGL